MINYRCLLLQIRRGKCGPLFGTLDKNLRRLDVDSYGVSDTSLEEVFLRVTAYTKQGQGAPSSVTINKSSINNDMGHKSSIELNTNFPRRQFGGSDRPRKRRLSRVEKIREEMEVEPDQPLPYVTDSFGRELTPDPVQRSDIKYTFSFTLSLNFIASRCRNRVGPIFANMSPFRVFLFNFNNKFVFL